MPGFVIKDLPPKLHRKLKEQAARHHRSMTREVLAVLERALNNEERPRDAPPPFKGRFPLTDEFIAQARLVLLFNSEDGLPTALTPAKGGFPLVERKGG